MSNELDSSEIIAYCLDQELEKDQFEISYEKIQAIGQEMEKRMPSLQVTYDMVSIDAFRCEFCDNVVMLDDYLRINRVKEVYTRIARFIPEPHIANHIYSIVNNYL